MHSSAHDNTSTGAAHKPTMGEKISGAMDTMVGKMTNNPEKVAIGEAKKTGEPLTAGTAANTASHGTSHGHHHDTTHSHHGAQHGVGHQDGSSLTGKTHEGQPGKPSLGEKVGGHKDEMMGRATNDPSQYAQGQARQEGFTSGPGMTGNHHGTTGMMGTTGTTGMTGTTAGGYGTGVGAAGVGMGSTTGYGAGTGYGDGVGNTGSGLTGNHGTHSTGTGLTGNHGHHAHDGGFAGGHGTHGNHGAHGALDTAGKPSMGDKMSGTMDTMVGKATNNPVKIAEGQEKKTYGTDSTGNTASGY